MNIPTFPTDNLYKFIALTGLFLFVFSFLYPVYQRIEIRNEMSIISEDIEKIDLEIRISKNKATEIDNKLSSLEDVVKNELSPTVFSALDSKINRLFNNNIKVEIREKELKEVKKEYKKIDSIGKVASRDFEEISNKLEIYFNEFSEQSHQIDIKTIEYKTKSKLLLDKQGDLVELMGLMVFFGPLSLLITIIGFILWYQQTQKYQDKIVREQANQYYIADFCQSCGMKLSNQNNYYLFNELDRKSIYCKTCYNDNGFTEPNLTLKEMKHKIKKRCKELGYNRLKTLIFVSRIEDLERWRKKFNW